MIRTLALMVLIGTAAGAEERDFFAGEGFELSEKDPIRLAGPIQYAHRIDAIRLSEHVKDLRLKAGDRFRAVEAATKANAEALQTMDKAITNSTKATLDRINNFPKTLVTDDMVAEVKKRALEELKAEWKETMLALFEELREEMQKR